MHLLSAYLLTYCPLCRAACRAATKVLHWSRSWASLWIVPHVWPIIFSSASAVLRHVCFGLPLLLLPSGVQWRAVLVMLSLSFLKRCPIHRHLLLIRMLSMLSWWHLVSSSSLVMVLGQNILSILLRLLVWNTSLSLRSFSVIRQHSEPYSRVEITQLR